MHREIIFFTYFCTIKNQFLTIMKKEFALFFVCLMAVMTCQAELRQFRGIDRVDIQQQIDLDTCNVYIVPTVLADTHPRKTKDIDKQQAAYDELGETIKKELKSAYKKATIEVIDNAKKAPAGAVIVEAILKDIDWSTATMKDMMLRGAKEDISGGYNIRVSNAKGVVLEIDNRRKHDTYMRSSNPVKIIRVYNEVIAEDLIDVLKKNK